MPRMRIASSHQGYATRAMQSADRRFARVFRKLGYQDPAAGGPGELPLPQRHPADALADEADALAFNTFRARSKEFLDTVPKSKAAIVAALRDVASGR